MAKRTTTNSERDDGDVRVLTVVLACVVAGSRAWFAVLPSSSHTSDPGVLPGRRLGTGPRTWPGIDPSRPE